MISILVICLVLSGRGNQDAYRVIVSDHTSEMPIAGALIFSDGEYAGTTDSTGSLLVSSSGADTSYISVVRTGYSPADTTRCRESVLSIIICPDPETMPVIQSEEAREPPGEWSLSIRHADVQDYETIGEQLDDLPGVRVESSSGDIGIGGVSLRGSPSSHTAVWIDGIPVSNAKFGTSRTQGLLPGIIERLDVYQGWTPSRLGGTSLGGGIELHTIADFREGIRMFGGYGSYGRFTGGVGAGIRKNGFATWLDLQWLRQGNSYRYVDDNATPFNSGDDTTRVRTNSSVEAVNLLAKLNLDISSSIQIGFISLGSWHWEGIPGPGANPIDDATHRSWDERIIVKASRTVPSSLLELTAYHELYSSTVKDPHAEIMHYTSRRKESGTNSGSRSFFRYDTHPLWAADGRFEVQLERFQSRIYSSTTTKNAESRTTMEFGSGFDLRPFNRLRVRGELAHAVIYDNHGESDSDRRFSHAARVALEITPGYGITVNGSYADRSRAPTLSELYGNRGSVRGNDALVPENGRQLEFGVAVRKNMNISTYIREVDDLIFYWLRSPRIVIPENIGHARMKGFEISTMHVLENIRMLTIRISALYQRTEDRSRIPYYRGNDLPGTPRTVYNGTMSMNPIRDFQIGFGIRTESEFYIDRANVRQEDSRIHTRVWFTLGDIESSSLAVHIDDVFNTSGSNQWGYPLPGRRLRAQVSSYF